VNRTQHCPAEINVGLVPQEWMLSRLQYYGLVCMRSRRNHHDQDYPIVWWAWVGKYKPKVRYGVKAGSREKKRSPRFDPVHRRAYPRRTAA
jgi:hypothetical protein